MITINKKTKSIRGVASVSDIKKYGLINASMMNESLLMTEN